MCDKFKELTIGDLSEAYSDSERVLGSNVFIKIGVASSSSPKSGTKGIRVKLKCNNSEIVVSKIYKLKT